MSSLVIKPVNPLSNFNSLKNTDNLEAAFPEQSVSKIIIEDNDRRNNEEIFEPSILKNKGSFKSNHLDKSNSEILTDKPEKVEKKKTKDNYKKKVSILAKSPELKARKIDLSKVMSPSRNRGDKKGNSIFVSPTKMRDNPLNKNKKKKKNNASAFADQKFASGSVILHKVGEMDKEEENDLQDLSYIAPEKITKARDTETISMGVGSLSNFKRMIFRDLRFEALKCMLNSQ